MHSYQQVNFPELGGSYFFWNRLVLHTIMIIITSSQQLWFFCPGTNFLKKTNALRWCKRRNFSRRSFSKTNKQAIFWNFLSHTTIEYTCVERPCPLYSLDKCRQTTRAGKYMELCHFLFKLVALYYYYLRSVRLFCDGRASPPFWISPPTDITARKATPISTLIMVQSCSKCFHWLLRIIFNAMSADTKFGCLVNYLN